MAFLFSFFCMTLGAIADAHPVAADLTAHHLRLTLDKTTATVDYQVWIPNSHLVEKGNTGDFLVDRLKEAQQGLTLVLNGETIPLKALDLDSPAVRAGGHVTGFQVALNAALPTSTDLQELLLINSVEPDEIANFKTEVFVHPSLQVLETSLLDLKDGQLTANRHGQWRTDEQSRETRVTFRKHPAFLQFPSSQKFRPIHKALGFPWIPLTALGIGGLALILTTARILHHRKRR